MGYSHYFEYDLTGENMEIFRSQAAPVIATILDEHTNILADSFGRHGTRPEFWDGVASDPESPLPLVAFNGVGDDSCESFIFGFHRDFSDYVKTNRRPYDIVVCKVLLTLAWYIPGFTIHSDGFCADLYEEGKKVVLDENWPLALDYLESVHGLRFEVKPDPELLPTPACRAQQYLVVPVHTAVAEIELCDPLDLEGIIT